jgi:hypothetical protein
MPNKFVILVCLCFASFLAFAQPYKSEVINSRKPWDFGFRVGGSYDMTTLRQASEAQWGYKIGFVAEKQLIYNVCFQPSVSFLSKGYKYGYSLPNAPTEKARAYEIEGVAGLVMKFGDPREQTGLIIGVSPYFTYGIGGSMWRKDTAGVQTKEGAFAQNNMNTFDLGFQLGTGYDLSSHFELGLYYYFGLMKIKSYNFLFKGVQLHFTYFL